jgi:hypothetical protein
MAVVWEGRTRAQQLEEEHGGPSQVNAKWPLHSRAKPGVNSVTPTPQVAWAPCPPHCGPARSDQMVSQGHRKWSLSQGDTRLKPKQFSLH